VGLQCPEHVCETSRPDHDLDVVPSEERLQKSKLKVPGQRRERSDAKHAPLASSFTQGVHQILAAREDRVRVVERDATGFGQDESLATPLEQRVAELRLELLDLIETADCDT
jgi:hypothetical protein